MIHLTPANFGWVVAIWLIAGTAIAGIWNAISGRWEITRGRAARRWYGPGAHVTLRAEAEADDPELYVVLRCDGEDASVPSLKVHKLNPEYLTYWDEDSEAFWAPVTCFAPYTVRRFRPHLIRCVLRGRVAWIPWLTEYLPLPGAAVPDARTPAEINTDYYLDATAGRTP